MSTMAYVVSLVDCNNFYVSCERVFDPKLEGRSVVVLSNNDGVIISRSNEAKALGIGMAVPFFKIRRLIEANDVQVFSANFPLYGDMSQRVMNTLSQFTPDMEIYSIDEAFLDFSGFKGVDLTAYGRKIRGTVKQWTGIPVSIGIAGTKTLAKIGNEIAKRSPKAEGVVNLVKSEHLDQALARVEVEEVWGIGRRSAPRLRDKGIETALDLREAEEAWIKNKFGLPGLRTVLELRGTPCLTLESSPPPKQGITTSRSFGAPVESLDDLKEAVADYVSHAAEKLRGQESLARILTVFLMTNPFGKDSQYHNAIPIELPIPTDSTPELLHQALAGTERIFRKGYRYHKAGVMLSGLLPRGQVQADLWEKEGPDPERRRKLMQALDRVNARMGAGTVAFAAEGIHKVWRMKSERRSKRYTTRWDELVEVTV